MARRTDQSGHAPTPLHVIPGAKGKPADVEEERTAIDPAPGDAAAEPWDDGSTTVEEATAAEAIARSKITGTNEVPTGSGDEPTFEDPARIQPALQLVPPLIRPRPAIARLVVVSGNDTGRSFNLDITRTMSIGRAVDNDVVLTDIAVSRRHLELSYDGKASWFLRDRGSGNGTLVNDQIEDGHYTLRNGDRVEIGNTVLRFEAPQVPPSTGWGQRDEDEASTIAGRAPPRPTADGPDPAVTSPVVKTRPPPPSNRQSSTGRKASATSPQRPSQLGAATQAPIAATRGERGDPSGSNPARRNPLPAPPGDDAAPVATAGPLAQLAAAGAETGSNPARHFTTTALVEPLTRPPTSFPYPFGIGAIPTRKLVLGSLIGAAIIGLIGVIAAVATSDDSRAPALAVAASLPASTWGTDETALLAAKPEADDDDLARPPGADLPDVTSGADLATPAAPRVVKPDDDADDEPVAIIIESDPPLAATDKPAEPAEPARPGATDKPAVIAPAPAVAAKPTTPAPAVPLPSTPPAVTTRPAGDTAARAAPTAPTAPTPIAPKPAPATTAAKPAAPKPVPAAAKPPPKRVAVTTPAPRAIAPRNTAAARKRAQTLYTAKDFRGAAAALRTAAAAADTDEAAELRDIASDYDTVGTSLGAGNAALASNAPDATTAFQRAAQADRRVGGAQAEFLRAKLAQAAPRAAASQMARGNFEAAKRAIDTAVASGASASPTVLQVRQSLERKAGELYAAGMKILSTEPDDARALLRRVLKIVDPASPWYAKAYKVVSVKPR